MEIKNSVVVTDYNSHKSIGRGKLLAKHLRALADSIDGGELILTTGSVNLYFKQLEGYRTVNFTAHTVEAVNLEED